MAKPLKFYQTLNQAPRSVGRGKHWRAPAPAHRHPVDRASDSPGGAGAIGPGGVAWDLAKPPKPPAIPYAGIRTGEITGYRLWWVIEESGEPWLCSLAHRRLWCPGETIVGEIDVPVGDRVFDWRIIWGGTYAFTSNDQLGAEIAMQHEYIDHIIRSNQHFLMWGWHPPLETQTLAAGTIKMWGDVVEHERGYRAQFAKLNSIDRIIGGGDLAALRAKYLPDNH